MKTALAIVCSLLLTWTQVVPAAAAAGDACEASACCSNCSQATCCAAAPASEPQPVSAAPTSSISQNQFLPPAALLAWTLPDTRADAAAASPDSSLIVADAPLYARHCVRLI